MSLLSDLNALLSPLIPIETGVFSGTAPDEYAIVTPLADTYELHSDNRPSLEVQEARISLFSRGNYQHCKGQIISALLNAEITITDRRCIGYEVDTGYHHYAIDVAHHYQLEE